MQIVEASVDFPLVAIVGLPLSLNGKLYNCAAVVSQGMLIGVVAGALVGTFIFGKMSTGAGIGMLIGLIAGLCIHKKPEVANAEQRQAEQDASKQKKN